MESKAFYSVGEKVIVKTRDFFGSQVVRRGVVRGVRDNGSRYGVEFISGGGAFFWRGDIYPLVNG